MKTIFSLLLLAALTPALAKPLEKKVIWTAVFSNVMPARKNVTKNYCLSHTPTVMTTTIEQITRKSGVRALNGINIRYLSYKTQHKNHVYFNRVDAVISGKDNHDRTWSQPMKLYEQTLTPIGATYTVWSTKNCKGTFLGTPTVVQR